MTLILELFLIYDLTYVNISIFLLKIISFTTMNSKKEQIENSGEVRKTFIRLCQLSLHASSLRFFKLKN